MIRRLCIGLTLMLLVAPLFGLQRRSARRGVPAYYQALEAIEDEGTRGRVVLRNGLRVLVDEFTIRPLATIVSTFNVGRAQADSKTIQRIGRRLWLAGDLSRQIHELGGWNEFESGLYDTSFISVLPAEKVLDALALHSQILSRTPGDEMPAEDSRNEYRSALEARLWQETFSDTAPASDRAGKVGDLKAFQQKHLHVGNLAIGISGRILRTNVYERVVSLYARFKAGAKASRPAVGVELGSNFNYLHLRDRSESYRVLMGFRIPGEGHADALALEMLEVLLSGGRGALLRRTQLDSGYSARAYASIRQHERKGLFQIDLSPLPEKVDSAEISVLSLLSVLGSEGPPMADLIRAKSQLVRRYFEERQQSRGRALGMARSELAGSHKDFWNRAEKLASITIDQVKKVAARYFVRENLVLVEEFPEAGEIRNFTAETLQETFLLLLPPERDKLAKELATTPEIEVQDLSFSDFKPILLDPPLRRTSVLRGPDIYLEEEHTVPLVAAGFYFPGGRGDETGQIRGVTEVMLRSLLAGVEEREGMAVWSPFETRGARFELVNQPEYFGIEVTVLADAFAPLLKNIVEWFQNPTIGDDSFERVRAEVIALAESAHAQPALQADLDLRSKLFKDHPYGSSRFGDVTSLSRLTVGVARDWATRQLSGFHPFIVIRGHVNGTSFLPPLVPVLSNSKLKVKPLPDLGEGEGAPFLVTSAGNRLWAGFRGPKRGSFDLWVLDVLGSLLELRDGVIPSDASLPQLEAPVRLSYQDFFNAGVVTVSTDESSDPEATQKKLLKLLSELERSPLRDDEVLRAVVLTITRFHYSQEDLTAHLSELAHNLLAGEKVGYRDEYLATVKGIQPADLRSLTGRIFGVAAETAAAPGQEGPSSP